MPDHLHLLVAGRCEDADFQKFVQAAKQASGFAYAKRARERLWQPSYHDRVLRDAEATLTVARYVVANPVRAGLVASVEGYPFVGVPRARYGSDSSLSALTQPKRRALPTRLRQG
jgi:REP element-mobilizing transposase RayT